MKQNKEDVRSRYTKRVICDALLKSLCCRPLKEITVSEICVEAQINRGTFYNHFYDIYDVYEYIESAFYDEILAKFDDIQFYSLDDSFYKEILLFISDNKNFSRLIVSNPSESSLLKKIVGYIKKRYISDFTKRFPALKAEKLELLFVYLTNGSIGIIVEWLIGNKPVSMDVVAEQINNINTTVINSLLCS